MKLKKILVTGLLATAMLVTTISTASATDLSVIKAYFENSYPTTEGYKIDSYSFDTENKVVVAKINKDKMQMLIAGMYNEDNSTVIPLTWVRTYFSRKYPSSQNYVIQQFSFDTETKVVKVTVSKDGEDFSDEVTCTVVSGGKGYIK